MADVSAAMKDWSSTDSSNNPSGSTNIGTGLDDNIRAIQGGVVRNLHHKGADIASATTTDLGAVEGLFHDITGTTTITGLGTVRAGVWKVIKFEGVLTLTHNATSLILPGAANITTLPGDTCLAVSEGSGNWRVENYMRFSGAPLLSQNKAIYGLTYSNNGSDATNDIDIAAGGCMDATGVYWMQSAALTKQSDAAWAVGSAAGWLDTGAIGNNDYYIWTIARSDTGVVDSLLSLSSTAPTMPANYNYKRLIGWFKRVGGTIVAFTTYETEGGGIELSWNAPTLDVNLANTLTTSRRTDALKVPLNFSVLSHANYDIYDATTGTNQAWICCPDQTDAAPGGGAAPEANLVQVSTAQRGYAALWIRTSATGTVASRSSLATVDSYTVSTMGFRWARRN